jgi:DNA-binding IclR family transcriptional regulator
MIQVLQRAFAVLEYLSDEPTSLAVLADRTGLHKSTLHNILRTMVSLGVVERAEHGIYALGPKLIALAEPMVTRSKLQPVAEETVRDLGRKLGERVAVVVIHKGQRYLIAQVESTHTVAVNPNFPREVPVYGAVTGRVILAHLSQSELDAFVQAFGLPGDQWPEASSRGELEQELARIRDAGMAERVSEDGEATFLAWPVFGPGHRVWASILVTLPTSRFQGEHRQQILSEAEAGAQAMSRMLLLPRRRPGGSDPI